MRIVLARPDFILLNNFNNTVTGSRDAVNVLSDLERLLGSMERVPLGDVYLTQTERSKDIDPGEVAFEDEGINPGQGAYQILA